jgi:hypothetical protein
LSKGLTEIEEDFSVKINVMSIQEADFNLRRKKDDQEIKGILKSKRVVLLGRV